MASSSTPGGGPQFTSPVVAVPMAMEHTPPQDGLPKPAHLIRAEVGIQIKGERHVIAVSLADHLQGVADEWCAQRGIAEKAKGKIIGQLQTRLDQAPALAYQEAEEEADGGMYPTPPPAAPPSDVC